MASLILYKSSFFFTQVNHSSEKFVSESLDMSLAPNRKAREICWSFRDKLFECLDKYNEDMSKCTEEIKGVENNCSKSWVSMEL